MNMSNTRQQQGELIGKAIGAIKRIDNLRYSVISQSGNGNYEVHSTELGWVCSCPDHKFRGVQCKHIHAVIVSFALRKEVEIRRIEPIVNIELYLL
jgi:putative transposase